MKNKTFTILCAGLLAMSILMSGCGNKEAEQPASETEETQGDPMEAAEAEDTGLEQLPETETPTPPLEDDMQKWIGVPTGDLYEGDLTNTTGKGIKVFQIKLDSAEEFGKNLLEDGDVFENDETRSLYFEKPEEAAWVENPSYQVRLTFEDDTMAVLHGFPFGDMENTKICMSEGMAYLVYDSISQNASVNTLSSEEEIANSDE